MENGEWRMENGEWRMERDVLFSVSFSILNSQFPYGSSLVVELRSPKPLVGVRFPPPVFFYNGQLTMDN